MAVWKPSKLNVRTSPRCTEIVSGASNLMPSSTTPCTLAPLPTLMVSVAAAAEAPVIGAMTSAAVVPPATKAAVNRVRAALTTAPSSRAGLRRLSDAPLTTARAAHPDLGLAFRTVYYDAPAVNYRRPPGRVAA